MQCHSFDIRCCLLVCSLRVRAMSGFVVIRFLASGLGNTGTGEDFIVLPLLAYKSSTTGDSRTSCCDKKNRRFLHDRSSNAFANASFTTSLRPSRRSAPYGVDVWLVSILLRHQSECPSLIALHLQRGTVCLNVLLGDSFTWKSHTVKLPWSRQHWVNSDFWSDHCPSSICESPWHPNHVVDHFAPFAAIVWLREPWKLLS